MGSQISLLQTSVTLILLIAGVVDDLRSQKVHNQIIIAGFLISILFLVLFKGPAALLIAGLSFLTAFVSALPIYMLRIFAGGDFKLFLVASLLLSWEQVLIALAASMIWGSLLGIFQVILKGQTKQFANNMLALRYRIKLPGDKVHKIPFTVAFLFGFLTSIFWGGGL